MCSGEAGGKGLGGGGYRNGSKNFKRYKESEGIIIVFFIAGIGT